MKILICRGNVDSPKSYPYWDELMQLIKHHEIKELKGILTEQEIIDLVDWCDTWITIDSFLPHLCAFKKLKPGIVIWGKSDPEIFGYTHNTNLLRSRVNLRPGIDQFKWWNGVPHETRVFVSAKEVSKAIQDKAY